MSDPRDRYLADAERFQAGANGRLPASLGALRRDALARFGALGFPTTRLEEWRFTNVAPIAETELPLAADGAAGVAAATVEALGFREAAIRLVFVNGRLAAALSSNGALPAGLEAGSLAEVMRRDPAAVEPYLGRLASFQDHAFVALNTAFLDDGAYVRIAANAVIEAPIQLLFLFSGDRPAAAHPRTLVLAGENSQAAVVESYGGDAGVYFTNAVTEIVTGPGAVVDHYRVVRESLEAFHTATLQAVVGRSGAFASHAVTLGGALVRSDANAVLDGEGADCTLNGLYMVNGRRLVDNHTLIDHARPHCTSHELYKGILDGRSRAVFNGKIVVRPDAQKTDAKQTNKALLLSENAQINTKPQLEIFADDVKCTHGATIGQLDPDALFYLRARGLSAGRARSMLIHAFASDILTRVKVAPIRGQLDRVMLELLPISAEDEVCYEQPD